MPATETHSTQTSLEDRLGRWVRRYLHGFWGMFVLFVLKQGWACLFGGLLLGAILASHYLWSPHWPIHRYDALFIFALVTQALFLLCGLETRQEAMIILVFHLTGTAMEWFKVSAGSWAYPEPGFFKLMHVPLFSGFMYASVGSYMARVIRVFDMSFVPYPRFALSLTLALAIYANFFTHHFLPDLRWGLVLATLVLYGRCWIRYRIVGTHFWRMRLPLAAFFSSIALWVAENIGTFTGTWLYAHRHFTWVVHPQKLVSWYLLLYVAFITVTLLLRPDRAAADRA
ncbi:DUF817 domain-containing protein [Asaia siamensis]|uniref:DUF817 domain-containing protein n=1 Tax=Asaia siamensis TaxID=110479 RepID=A0ABQ1MEY1_9PROT|nr:DUF817 domain-containing protein [Asaia siamensis]GBR06848.1 hypothetical protein AA0323_1561 [Asaia siamensis NRIC 0323]GGC39387.1 hypothetical protein GCM10007207_26140 [Asaia siamensis]